MKNVEESGRCCAGGGWVSRVVILCDDGCKVEKGVGARMMSDWRKTKGTGNGSALVRTKATQLRGRLTTATSTSIMQLHPYFSTIELGLSTGQKQYP